MKPDTYKALLKALQKLQKNLVASQIDAVRRSPAFTGQLQKLHVEAEVGGRFDDFVATSARKSTVLFLLRSVLVRVLEDLGILGLKRIRDEWGFAAFREVAPSLGFRSYFKFVFRDLAADFPSVFAAGDDELPLPNEDGCTALWRLWHYPNSEGEHYVWNGDGFDSHFLGDLYQDLDADIRKRYALRQTPRFVEEYILDHTLSPALARFDPAGLFAAGDVLRVIDPTCGSGHFLIGAFHRLADYWRDQHGLNEFAACERALESVWGCDLNPHAVEIAQFRLLLEVVSRTGVKDLERLAHLTFNLRAMDSLIPWDRAEESVDMFTGKDRLDAYATTLQRNENAAFLRRKFHVIVGNPPYIQPKDDRKTDDYRVFWPRSAKGHYGLSGPFFERFFQLGLSGACVGFITAKGFASSEFGESLIRTVIRNLALDRIVDTSRVTIPGHGTPTLIVFGRNSPRDDRPVEFVTATRGERRRLAEPEKGLVWKSIASVSLAQPLVGVASLGTIERAALDEYPWELADPLELETLAIIKAAPKRLEELAADFGYSFQTNCDEAFLVSASQIRRFQLEQSVRVVCEGESVRDYKIEDAVHIICPYDGVALVDQLTSTLERSMWPWRTTLYSRVTFSGGTYRTDVKRKWFQWHQYSTSKHKTPLSLVFSDVVTHNHFALDRGGRVFSRHSPIIKLKSLELQTHLDLLGLLGSSTAAFWIRRTFRTKGAQGTGEGIKTEIWEQFVEPDSSKMGRFPVAENDRLERTALAEALDLVAAQRAECLPAAVLSAEDWSPDSLQQVLTAAETRHQDFTRQMVALQEELDWLTYRSYGLTEQASTVGPDAVEPLTPGHRPFEIVFARNDSEVDDEEKSAWWSRHNHERATDVPASYSTEHQVRIRERIELIESDPRIGLLESPTYKRRWEPVDWPKETTKASESWLLDRLEVLFGPARDNQPAGPLAEPKPYRLEDIALAWSRDSRVAAVAGVWTGTGASVDVTLVAEKLLRSSALPDNPLRLYSDEGLRKLREWKRVWALQDQEDAWQQAVTQATSSGGAPPPRRLVDPDDPSVVLEDIPKPPKFDKGDFIKAEFASIRGQLNVARERFILFAELSPPRFGWNGWHDRQRALAQVEAFTLAEGDPQAPLPVPTSDDPRRCGVTFGLWESLPNVRRWGASGEYEELHSFAQEACRQPRCPCPIVEAWKSRSPGPDATAAVTLKRRTTKTATQNETDALATDDLTVSVAERAWVASLFAQDKELDATGVWTRHQSNLAQPTLPGVEASARGGAYQGEFASLSEARLFLVLDDLVASGDLEVRGRGTKRRYRHVLRPGKSSARQP